MIHLVLSHLEALEMPGNENADLLEKVVAIFQGADVDYGDARFESSQISSISKDKIEENASHGSFEGFHLRALKGDEWRAVSLAGADRAELLSSATQLSKFVPVAKGKPSHRPLEPCS